LWLSILKINKEFMKKILLTISCIASLSIMQAQIIVSVEEPAVISGGYNFTYSNNGWSFPDMNLVQNAVTSTVIVANDGTAGDSLGCNTWTIPAGGIVTELLPNGTGSGYSDASGVITTTDGNGTGLIVDIVTAAAGQIIALDDLSIVAGSGYVTALEVATTGGSGSGLTVNIIASTSGPVDELGNSSLNSGEGYITATGVSTTGGSGTGLTVNIVAEEIGAVEELDVNTLTPGEGYITGSDITTSTSASGTGLTVDIEAEAIGGITMLDLMNTGTDYIDGVFPTTPFSGSGEDLVVAVITDGGAVLSVTVVDGGHDYSVGDIVIINGGNNDADIVVLEVTNGEVTSVVINQPGVGYEVNDLITIDGGNGGATIEVLEVTNGKITAITIADAGTGYEVGDEITIDGGTVDATIMIDAVLDGEISTIEIVEGGTGYEVGDVITIDGGNGDATIEVLEVTDGAIESITIVSGGIGYASGDEITISGGNGDATFEVGSITGHIALIYRGGCEFGMKALRAQQAGAIGVVMVNNVPGLINMGGGAQGTNVTIPAVMISMQDGALIREQVDANENVVMYIGSKTGLYANDAGMFNRHTLKAKASATPLLLAQNASEFNVQTGTWVTNYGYENQTNITVSAEITFGGNQVYFNESTPFDLIAGDSLYVSLGTFSQATYSIGLYTLTYTIVLDGITDDYPGDNKNTSTFAITENTFGIAEVGTNGLPVHSSGIRSSNATSSFSGCVVVDNPNASRLAPTGITFAASTLSTSELTLPDAGIFTLEAIEWSDAFTDLDDPNLNISDIQVRAGGEFSFDADDQGEFVFAPFTNSFVLQDNKRYMFCITTLNEDVYLAFDTQSDYSQNENTYSQPIMTINSDGTYSLGFTTPAYPSMLVHFTVAAAVGVEETNEVQVTPYPNPAQDFITVPMTGFNGEATLTIIDMYGKVINVQRINTNAGSSLQVNVQDMSNGMYSFRLVDESGVNSVFNVMIAK
jgi:hypothetical protein